MKIHHRCPKCGDQHLLRAPQVAATSQLSPAAPQLSFEALICASCHYTELYAADLQDAALSQLEVIDDHSADTDHPGPPAPPETEEFLLWSAEEIEITEISRVSERPDSGGVTVVLADLGPRPTDIFNILNRTLGLEIPSLHWLRNALPYVVLDRLSLDAAQGLKGLLENAGGVVTYRQGSPPESTP